MPSRGGQGCDEDFEYCVDILHSIVQRYTDTHVIVIGGDMNVDLARVNTLRRQKVFSSLVQELQLSWKCVGPTFIHPNGTDSSAIDYILVHGDIDFTTNKIEEPFHHTADHYPVRTVLKAAFFRNSEYKSTTGRTNVAKIRWNKLDVDLYRALVYEGVQPCLSQQLDCCRDIENAISTLSDVLTKSADLAGPTKTKMGTPITRIRNEEINGAERESKLALWRWKEAGKPNDKDHPLVLAKKKTKADLRRAIRVEQARKRENTRSQIMDTHVYDPKTFNRLIKRERSSASQCPTEIIVDGTTHSGENGILTGWQKHFENLASPTDAPDFDCEYNRQVLEDIDNIIDICNSSDVCTPPLTFADISKAFTLLNTGKAGDFYGLTVEHFKHASDQVIPVLLNILNAIVRLGMVPDSVKIGLLTPVYKRKGDKSHAVNYRGITVIPVISKVLETILLERLRETLTPQQNPLQRGFTAGSSPLNCSLLLQEAVNDAKDKKKPIYISFLDAKAAFDVVSHPSLLRKLFVSGIEGKLWTILSQMHENATSAVKWQGSYSPLFDIRQGVRQGGILSTDLYKVYINALLDRISNSGLGYKIGTIPVPAPTCADDIALVADDPMELQILIDAAVDYSRMERYMLQPAKSGVMTILPSTYPGDIEEAKSWSLGEAPIQKVHHIAHMGILRSTLSPISTVVQDNIKKGRRATYSLMATGLHGHNGLDPQTACHILLLYVLPVLLYGLEILLPSRNELQPLERQFRKLLKQVFSLPDNSADCAVYVISGFAPMEMEIHRRALMLYGSIIRDESCLERQLLERQLLLQNGTSWFLQVKKLLVIYNLPSPSELLSNIPTKDQWKHNVNKSVKTYWRERIITLASLTSTTRYLCADNYYPGVRHAAITSVSSCPKDIKKVHTKLKLLSGNYILQSNRSAFNQQLVDPTCLLCDSAEETLEHFILHCPKLEEARSPVLLELYQCVDNLCGVDIICTLSSALRLQLVLDCSLLIHQRVLPVLDGPSVNIVETITRRLCFRLHATKCRLLNDLPTRRGRVT